jgi:hypothetical protein
MRETQMRSFLCEDLNRGAEHLRMVIPEDARPKPAVKIDIFISISIPQASTFCPRKEQRIRFIPTTVSVDPQW